MLRNFSKVAHFAPGDYGVLVATTATSLYGTAHSRRMESPTATIIYLKKTVTGMAGKSSVFTHNSCDSAFADVVVSGASTGIALSAAAVMLESLRAVRRANIKLFCHHQI
jgi:hypothetical protein